MKRFPWPGPRRRLTIAHMMNAVAQSALTFWVGSWYLSVEQRRDPMARLIVQTIPAVVIGFWALLDAPIVKDSARDRPPTRP